MLRLLLLASLAIVVRPAAGTDDLPKILFFSHPMTSDNDVIRRAKPDELSTAEKNFAELSRDRFDVTFTQSGSEVNAANLARYRAVVFFTALNPPGVDIDALTEWVKRGGAFAGIHSTANSFLNRPAFGDLLGADFDRRPWRTPQSPQVKVVVRVRDSEHPATRGLEETFPIVDDVYQFKNFDPNESQLLLSLDPASLDLTNPKVNRADKVFPISWARTAGDGRVFYTVLGDWEPTWKDPRYRTHLAQAILWAMKLTPRAKVPGHR
jgi:type 1 glutamine amidotransferase